MDLSVVVATFNSAECVGGCLDAVRRHVPSAEIVVVDNASADDSLAAAAAAAPNATVVANTANKGFGRAANAGAEAATRGHVLFLNPDVVVTHCDSPGLEKLFERTPFGLIGPATKLSAGVIGAQREPRLVHDWLEQTVGFVRPRKWRRRPAARPAARSKLWLSGSMLLANREEFLRMRGFDPRFFLYYEDRDLCARYREGGLPIRETTALGGRHLGTASSGADTLRIAPAGWAFLGWIEYVFLHRGPRAAQMSARSALATLRALRVALRTTERVVPTERIRRKRAQLEALLDFIDEEVGNSRENAYCPDAVRLLQPSR